MTLTNNDFTERFRSIVLDSGWHVPTRPAQVLGAWEDFVTTCTDGYEFDMSEYLNDLSIRRFIQLVLDDSEAKRTEMYTLFVERIRRIDDRFRELVSEGPLIRPGSDLWWDRRIPPYGAAEFVEDARERYSVELRVVDS
ncbi:hypothetical protein OG426_07760 [Streptomyces canus]|uniref:hypothetical protein n=1 Tax=Streptomyces canus TaxID=58343 RepID=UPI002256D901|nr:hypothetical protein [Streptomyces canus]MCX4852393.1 hypothetical protein [Streptomyces canus]WSW32388.1 hypothetical protein OG426_07760 [Streptomyces canus]